MSKNRIACLIMCLLVLLGCIWLCGCSEAAKVNKNISKQADYFETERRITVYNARTDKIILEAEGLVAPGILIRSTLERHIYRAG